MADFTVTPYEVKGAVDYDKLIRQFGTTAIDRALLDRIQKHTGELHFMLRRGVFFSHRDFNWLLDEYEKKNPFYIYTGRGPSGKVHIGHLVPWMFCKWLQDKFDVHFMFQMSDDEKFFFKEGLDIKEATDLAYENVLDMLALGFDPKKTKVLIDTVSSGTMYKHAVRFAKKITASTVKASFGLKDSDNIGKYFYTSMQAVPAILESVWQKKNVPCLIPLGFDQDPHFRLARDVYPKLGYYKPAIIHSRFVPPLEGVSGKMSSSNKDNAIFTTDTPEEVARKVKKYAFSGGKDTIEEHRKLGGNPDIDVSFQYLAMAFEPDDRKLASIRDDYKSGKLLSGELKQILIEKINAFLKEHQRKREEARKILDSVLVKD